MDRFPRENREWAGMEKPVGPRRSWTIPTLLHPATVRCHAFSLRLNSQVSRRLTVWKKTDPGGGLVVNRPLPNLILLVFEFCGLESNSIRAGMGAIVSFGGTS